MHRAHHDVENISGREVVELPVQRPEKFVASAVQRLLFVLHLQAAAQVRRCRNCVHGDDAVDTHLLEHVHRQGVGNAAIHVGFPVNDDRSANAGNRNTRLDRGSQIAARKNRAVEGIKIGGNDTNRALQFGKVNVADGSLQASFDGAATNETFPRREHRVHQTPDSPTPFHFARELFHRLAVAPITPDSRDVSAHAASRDDIHLDAIFLQNLNDTYVSQTLCAAG